MATYSTENTRSASTTFAWRQVKIAPARRAQGASPQASSGWRNLARWSRKETLTISVVHRGGAESWWLVKARGRSGVFPGHRQLEDVMAEILAES